jgi:hypothetical protein
VRNGAKSPKTSTTNESPRDQLASASLRARADDKKQGLFLGFLGLGRTKPCNRSRDHAYTSLSEQAVTNFLQHFGAKSATC